MEKYFPASYRYSTWLAFPDGKGGYYNCLLCIKPITQTRGLIKNVTVYQAFPPFSGPWSFIQAGGDASNWGW